MMISTRGRYAIRTLLELAQNRDRDYVPIKDVAQRLNLSLKYIQAIMALLSKNGLVDGVHGKGGGYRLARTPAEYKIGEILRLTEGNLAPVACLECDAKPCEYAEDCLTLPMWRKFHKTVNTFFDDITLADLLNGFENAV